MKKAVTTTLAVLALLGAPSVAIAQSSPSNNLVEADAKQAETELRQLLQDYAGFSAAFTQSVTDSDNNLLHSAQGQLQFKQPGQFRWQIEEPEPELLLSDGTVLWWYNPFVEQVSIFDAADAVATTPFALLVSQSDAVWSKFAILKDQNAFVITPKDSDGQVLQLSIKFKNNILTGIQVISRSRRVSDYALSKQTFDLPKDASFTFDVPAGTDIDDQRRAAQELISDGNVQF